MAISTYGELKTAIASWLHRSDLTSVIPDFVRLAEAELRRDVRIPSMQLEAAGSLTAGNFTLPADFLEAKRLTIGNQELSYITVEEFQRLTRNGYSAVHYYIRVGQQVRVLNGGTSAYSLLYWAKFAALTLDVDTNWLLTNAPDLYLWKSCEKGAIYTRNAEVGDRFRAMYSDALGELMRSERESEYSGSILEIHPNNVPA